MEEGRSGGGEEWRRGEKKVRGEWRRGGQGRSGGEGRGKGGKGRASINYKE